MVSEHHRSFPVADRSYLSLIKKEVHQMGQACGLTATQLGHLDIIIAEIGSNFIKHAGGGEFLIRCCAGHGIDIFGIDNGPGIPDLARMMEDGASTTNTLGGGLGAIRRLSDQCHIYSLKGWGTIVYAQLLPKTAALPELQYYDLLVPYPGELVCGDGFALFKKSGYIRLFLGDGLGHGQEAHAAVQTAAAELGVSPETSPSALIRSLHAAARKTRGLVGTVGIYHAARRSWQFCGVGNISTRVQNGLVSKNHMSYNGIIGHSIPRTLNDQTIPATRGQYVLLSSDGIRTRWETSKYPNIFRHPPCILAAAVYKDNARRNDDASVVVIRMN